MSLEYFIAKRIHFQQGRKNVSRPAVRIAILAMSLGIVVMLIAVSVVLGFKQEIRNKVMGFSGAVRITNFDSNNTFETHPIVDTLQFIQKIKRIPEVVEVFPYATKPGIIKTNEAFQGIVLKGIGNDYNLDFLSGCITQGTLLHITDTLNNHVILSEHISKLLNLKLNDSFFAYFFGERIRARKFTITGIYATNFIELDKTFIFADIRHVQHLNNWSTNQYSGFEVLINDHKQAQSVAYAIDSIDINAEQAGGKNYFVQTVNELYPQMFGWLDLLDLNVWVILMLMMAVAGFNMISGIMILILERTNMIGILKSMGAANTSIRTIFMYYAVILLTRGMLWGNVVGLSVCAIQYYFQIVPLNAEAYFMPYVPVLFDWTFIVLLNLGVFVTSVLMMLLPSYLIANISPAKTIRYE